ncbi:HEAT repeat domain-containing protein [Microcoleus sp. Pol17_C1]|uniref:HEAT repeat domain-containing protein n=1 Tax=unclassified Microcoleus TaxID=2642155 RepID=UPI002FD2AA1C
MIIEFGALGLKITQAIAPKIAEIGFKEAMKKFNPSDFEKACTWGIKAAQKTHELFSACEQGVVEDFLKSFLTGAALPELLKPFNDQEKPQVNFLVEAFNATVPEHKKIQDRFHPEILHDWLEVFAEIYFQKTSSYLRFKVAKADYLKQLANWFDDVKFAGIAVEGQEIEKSEKLAHIFVMPDVLEEVNISSRLDIQELEEGKNLQQMQRETRSGGKFLVSKLLKPNQSLLKPNQSNKFVFLGAPGSGKTTLLSFFAVMLAQNAPEKLGWDSGIDCLPILIKIRDFARLSDINILDYARQFAEKTMSVKRLPEGFFEYWLADGRAMILLDGLDEVVEESKRYAVVKHIESFLGQYHQNRAIITSRPAGYKRDFFNTSEFEHYQLQLFDDLKVNEFINRWYDSRVRDAAEAQRRKDSIKKALAENDRIKLLARNPLLLTIIALIHRYQAVLPRSRHKLYEKAVETLLKNWDANKNLTEQSVFKCLDADDLRRLMEILAYWIHTQGSTDNPEGGTLIVKEDLLDQLTQNIKTKKQVQRFQAKEEAKRFVVFIQQRTGLLNEQGQDLYAFVHKTFQEYLCAQEISYQADDDDDFQIVLNHIREHLPDPHWREVLLLLIAQQKPKKAAKAMRAILAANSEHEQWLHRDLFFAGSCLAENIKELKVADSSLTVEILENLVELEVRDEALVGERVRSQVLQILCSMSETEFEAQTLQLLKARGVDENRLWRYQAALGEKEAVITAMLLRLENGNEDVRREAAQALGGLRNASETVISALLLRLEDGDNRVRRSAARALGRFGKASEAIIGNLLPRLEDCNNSVRSSAAEALGDLGNASEAVISALVLRLEDGDHSVRSSAAQALGNLGNASETVTNALVLRLEDGDDWVRSSAAQALGNLGNASEAVITALVLRLEDGDKWVRTFTVLALGNLGNASEAVITALVLRLEDGDNLVRAFTASALGYLGNASETVINALLLRLEDGKDSVDRLAASALANLGNASETVINALLLGLEDGEDWVRSEAAEALGKLGLKSSEVLPAVVQWVEQHQNTEYVGSGIDLLWDLVAGEGNRSPVPF